MSFLNKEEMKEFMEKYNDEEIRKAYEEMFSMSEEELLYLLGKQLQEMEEKNK
jgi:hypothetical protein